MIVDSELGTRSPTALGLNRTQRHLHVPGTRTDSEEGYTLQYSTLQAFCFFYTLRRIVPATYSSTHRRFRLASAPQSWSWYGITLLCIIVLSLISMIRTCISYQYMCMYVNSTDLLDTDTTDDSDAVLTGTRRSEFVGIALFLFLFLLHYTAPHHSLNPLNYHYFIQPWQRLHLHLHLYTSLVPRVVLARSVGITMCTGLGNMRPKYPFSHRLY